MSTGTAKTLEVRNSVVFNITLALESHANHEEPKSMVSPFQNQTMVGCKLLVFWNWDRNPKFADLPLF